MALVLEETRPTALKPHHCDICRGLIGVGDCYVRQRNVGEDGAYTFKGHRLCWAAWTKAYRALDLYEDESPDHDYDVRPIVEGVFAALASGQIATPDNNNEGDQQ